MDPDVALKELVKAVIANEQQEAETHLADLLGWLDKGGFAPTDPYAHAQADVHYVHVTRDGNTMSVVFPDVAGFTYAFPRMPRYSTIHTILMEVIYGHYHGYEISYINPTLDGMYGLARVLVGSPETLQRHVITLRVTDADGREA